MTRDPVFDEVAYAEALKRGYTCSLCRWWQKLSTGEEYCEQARESFPRLCRAFEIREHDGPRGH